MTNEEKEIARDHIDAAYKELEFVLDMFGAELDYRAISVVHPVLRQVDEVRFLLMTSSCYS